MKKILIILIAVIGFGICATAQTSDSRQVEGGRIRFWISEEKDGTFIRYENTSKKCYFVQIEFNMKIDGIKSHHGWSLCNTTSESSNGLIYMPHLGVWSDDSNKVTSVRIIEFDPEPRDY